MGTVAITKAVCPGARCVNLLSAAAEFSITQSFGHVIVHVGANYFHASKNGGVPMSPEETSLEIQDFLVAVGDIFGSKVTFSSILPQVNRSMMSTLVSTHSARITVLG